MNEVIARVEASFDKGRPNGLPHFTSDAERRITAAGLRFQPSGHLGRRTEPHDLS